jgi:hypothetical protein
MRHLGTVLGAGVLLVLVAGCAQQTGPAAAGGPGLTTGSSAPVTPPPFPATTPATVTMVPGPPVGLPALPPGSVPVAGTRVDAHALPHGFPHTVWTERNGTVLGFLGEVGGCFISRAVVDQQTARQVTVRLIQQAPGTGERACPMFVRYKPMTVTLAAPLGERTVQLLLSTIRG